MIKHLTGLKGLFLYCAFCLTLFSVSGSEAALAQSHKAAEPAVARSDDGAMLQMLLDEVRQLRLMLERVNLNIFRAQTLVERVRSQQGRVDRLARQLEEMREQTASMRSNQPQNLERVKELENRVSQEQDAAARTELEAEYREMKNNLDRQSLWEQQQQERETKLANLLRAEQDKLRELNEQLDALEHEMQRPPSADSSGSGKKRP